MVTMRICLLLALLAVGAITTATAQALRTFATAEEAAQALIRIVKADNADELNALLGPDARELADADPAAARQNRKVFAVAAAEGWRLAEDGPNRRTLVVGNESWPFPIPIVKTGTTWRFDTAAGKEEVVTRRIGRNELAVINTCRAYVAAQRRYAQEGHDGKPAGLFATTIRSDPGTHNGLYWPVADGEKRSPLGDLVAEAAQDGSLDPNAKAPMPFHGYYFRILTAQGAAAPGGAKSYVVNGQMSGGFALVAWPARYDVTGVMTFMINHAGVLYEKDLGAKTDSVARAMTRYNPDSSWRRVADEAP
jgi:hypothetical protein